MLEIKRPMERRHADRRPYRAPVRVHLTDVDPGDGLCFSLDCCDVSPGGVFLQTDLLLSLGERVEVEIPVDGRLRPIRREGRVVRVVTRRHDPCPGFAVALEGLSVAEQAALARAA